MYSYIAEGLYEEHEFNRGNKPGIRVEHKELKEGAAVVVRRKLNGGSTFRYKEDFGVIDRVSRSGRHIRLMVLDTQTANDATVNCRITQGNTRTLNLWFSPDGKAVLQHGSQKKVGYLLGADMARKPSAAEMFSQLFA